jgi:hypothetical protein
MLQFELLRDRGVLILSPKGPLEKADFERLAREIDPYIAESGKLTGVMVCAKSFPGWNSVEALLSHLSFVRDHHRKVARIAAVTDSEFLGVMIRISKPFVSAEARRFPYDQRAEAMAWLESAR